MKNIRLAIVDNAIDHSVYTPVAHWRMHLPLQGDVFHAPSGELPDLEDGYTHLILTGSEASIVKREPWADREAALVQKAASSGLAMLGSCWGHQLLALALSGPENVRRCDTPEIGWLPVRILEDSPLLGKGEDFYAYTVHFDEVVDLGREFRILASTPQCPIHAFQLEDRPIWGVQSHPEINITDGRLLFQRFLEQGGEATPLFRAALTSPENDSGMIRRIIETFL
ncbi:MAG: type 1 glutamine amidotransferase [Candidatus Aminicenantaceae bacterium]